MPSLVISLFRYVIIIIPAAFILSRFFGAYGVWNAFWVAEVVAAAVSLIVYRRCVNRGASARRATDSLFETSGLSWPAFCNP